MREMKDSGGEWIGSVPDDWKNDTVRHLIIARDGGAWGDEIREDEEGTICLRIADFDYEKGKFKDCDINVLTRRCYPESQVQRLRLEKGDILVEKSGGGEKTPVGRAVLFDKNYQALFANFMERLRFNAEIVIPEYAEFWLRAWYSCRCSPFYINQTIGIQNINLGLMLAKERIFYPPIEQQQIIVAFLDAKCAEIDALTADIQTQIDTLEQYRRSVITEAVTKGQNPDAKKKDCQIAGISLIPDNWEASQFKYIATIMSNLVNPEGYEEYPQISPDNIEKNSGRLLSYTTVEESGVISGNHLFFAGQILYSKIRPNLNKVTIAPFDGLCSADMYPIETNQEKRFILYMMLSNYFVEQVSLVIQDRVKMPKINQDELGGIEVILPPINEQRVIADFLDGKCAEIDTTLEDKRQQLETLADYKKSLIFEYVTGKKEVPVS